MHKTISELFWVFSGAALLKYPLSHSVTALPEGEPRGVFAFFCTARIIRTAPLPLPLGEVPQCAHWGGEGTCALHLTAVDGFDVPVQSERLIASN